MRYIFNLFARGFGRGTTAVGAIQWQLNRLAALYVGVIAFCIFLAAHEKNAASWIFLLAYLWIVLNILPYIWAGFKALGRRYGTKWSDENIRGATKVLLVFGAFPFFYTGVLNTSDHQLANLVLLVTIIPVMAFCALQWPEKETAFTAVGLLMCTLCAIIALATVYNTIDRSVTDPVVLKAREVQERLVEQGKARDARRFELIQQHIDKGWKLEKEHLDWYNGVMRQAAETPAAQVKSLISGASAAIAGEGSATTSTSANWLGKNWPILAGAVLIILIVVLIARRRKTVTATVTVAASPAARKYGFWDWVGVILSIITIPWLIWVLGPGKSEMSYTQVRDRQAQTLNQPDFATGEKLMWTFKGNPQKIPTQFMLNGEVRKVDLAQELMIEGAYRGQCFKQPKKGTALRINWATETGQHQLELTPAVNLEIRISLCYDKSPFMRKMLDIIPTL